MGYISETRQFLAGWSMIKIVIHSSGSITIHPHLKMMRLGLDFWEHSDSHLFTLSYINDVDGLQIFVQKDVWISVLADPMPFGLMWVTCYRL